MGKRIIDQFAIGDLVEWREPYADGLLIRDMGQGMILKKHCYDFGFKSGVYINYEVYRTKHADIMYFEAAELKKI
tara:strand:- start:174 stop:398 length:225 start_codon:yes stop_codon:yes gene_type:complete